jgi:hypothetical protein
VQWSNSVGGQHNVRSCTVDQLGCDGLAAAEPFTSGPPESVFTYAHTFTVAGDDPAVCQPHVPDMTGRVVVADTGAAPPGVPDRLPAQPLRVTKLDPLGGALALSWDVTSCSGAIDHHLIHGWSWQLPTAPGETFGIGGSTCAPGAAPPFTWNGVPDPATQPQRLLWFLMLASDGATTEGSWGRTSAGDERAGPGAGGVSETCGMTFKSVANTCGH